MSMKPNTRMLAGLAFVIVVMAGLAYAAVPLYSLFCKTTGYGGTTQRAEQAPAVAQVNPREVTVHFNADVNGSLPWDFEPEQRTVKVHLGQVMVVKYKAHNRGGQPIVGTATYNVQPDKAGEFFNKIQCFCFTEQVLQPGETLELPVQFFVDPALADDEKYADLTDITLSYTFFAAKDQSKAQAAPSSK